MGDYLAIIKRNLFTPIVIAILLLAGALLYVGEHRDAWFVSTVIILNSILAIIQEFRAKSALRKLELISAPKAKLIKNGNVTEVDYASLKTGDEVVIIAGDDVPADMDLESSRGLEVDESMLTGESIAVEKETSEPVFAGTTVVAGEAQGKVVAVGVDTKAGKIGSVLKRYKPESTPLQKAIQKAISWLTFGAIGLAILIIIVYYFSGYDATKILKTITSSAVSIVPEGLLLASSLLLAFGSINLAQAKVLPQKLSAVEAMALLDLLCVDKTGTLTEDKITLESIEAFGETNKRDLIRLAFVVAKEASGGNSTGKAVIDGLNKVDDYLVIDTMAFSSARKMSAVRFELSGRTRTIFMGAPELASKMIAVDQETMSRIDGWASEGKRVLLIVESNDKLSFLKDIKDIEGVVLGAILLTNNLRPGVQKTVNFLQEHGVSIKVISGDSPKTVQYVATQAGINNPDKVTTGESLAGLGTKPFEKAADEMTIFARVLPEQKETLVKYYRRKGLFTGMVGDGVNDALALKAADLGVAMFAGAPVSRRVSDIILLNNSFNSLPLGMKLGNRIMQAIEIIATLFFHKIIFSIILLLGTMALGMVYPFEPRHITFMNIFLVTMPTIMWTLFPPMPRHRVNPRKFWRETLLSVAPIALITGLTILFTYWAMTGVYHDRPLRVSTMTVLVTTFFGVYMVFLVDKMFRISVTKRTKRARLLYLAGVVFVALTSFSIGFLRDFFDFSAPTVWVLWPALAIIVLAAMLQWRIAIRIGAKYKESIMED